MSNCKLRPRQRCHTPKIPSQESPKPSDTNP
ncbi:hypothetical protein COLO4_20611 [Corchorus olitorius]|uniref:Uncharacterized protein n=1 Tax=Corchorus olitorius TaxID=93759 RepID=A0A1R3IYQ7_9ROSI|nr:hypothetical protein COLO4_20611 [Corchorus olitorius]